MVRFEAFLFNLRKRVFQVGSNISPKKTQSRDAHGEVRPSRVAHGEVVQPGSWTGDMFIMSPLRLLRLLNTLTDRSSSRPKWLALVNGTHD